MIKKSILKSLSYSFSANLVSIFVSIAMIVIVPKYTSLEEYGIWQLFIFYFGYAGFFHLGWIDGLYLRYGGQGYDELDKKNIFTQICGILVLQLLMIIILTLFVHNFVINQVKKQCLIGVVLLLPLVQFNTVCSYILQISNRIKDYARQLVAERLTLFVFMILALVLGYTTFINLYIIKFISMVIACCIALNYCKEIFSLKFDGFSKFFFEAKTNVCVGSKLLIANIANLLIVGIVRYGISIGWDVVTFGKISLTLSMCNFFMTFINAISVVLFPVLKQADKKVLSKLYSNIRFLLSTLVLLMLISYYPLKITISAWLPRYADSLNYMVVLFPICLFASKRVLLVNTYLKSMRQERLLMTTNIVTVMVSIVLTYISVIYMHNFSMVVYSIVFLYAFACLFAEYYLHRILKVSLMKDTIVELLMVETFIITGEFFQNWNCMLVYSLTCFVYLFFNRNRLKNLAAYIR